MTHAEKCDPEQGCAPGCEVDDFLQTLEKPLLGFEVAAEEQARERLASLMRGEINVA